MSIRGGVESFITLNGSVVVRKDWKILLADISGVRGEVGAPPKPPGELAIYVAQVILGCWAGNLRAAQLLAVWIRPVPE